MNLIKKALVTLGLGFFSFNVFAATSNTPEGYWKTMDDVTGKPKSIIHIWKTEDNILVGKVTKIFPKDGSNDQHKVCTACTGERHNQPIVGMVILSGLKVSDGQWDNGRILDPENGKTYSCSLRTTDSGKKLNVHGYIGIPLLGRSQLWEKVG